MAIKTIKTSDPGFSTFVTNAKDRIIRYYLDQEENLLRQSDMLAAKDNYEEAIYFLSLVPEACGDTYIHCQEKMLYLSERQRDFAGQRLLSQAKAAWAKSPNSEGADQVYPLISQIDPGAACYKDVAPFLREITKKLTADEKRAWEFKLQQYEDAQAKERREYEFRLQQYEDDRVREQRDFEAREAQNRRNDMLRRQEIEAARSVAVEFARNMPDVVYETVLLW